MKNKNSKKYRTRSKAGNIAEIPQKLPLITNSHWQNAMTYNDNETAYLQPLSFNADITCNNNVLMLGGLPATAAPI